MPADGILTGGVCELILLPLDPVLQGLSLATRLLDASLHCLWRHIIWPACVHRRMIAPWWRVVKGGGGFEMQTTAHEANAAVVV